MHDVDLAADPGAADLAEGFEVVFTDDEGEHRLPLVDAGSVPFELCRPVRSFPSYKGQRHYSGRWWTATTGTLVGYESWLERDTLIVLDFDADVVGIASQPFWLRWTTRDGKPRSHAPDYFARLADGSVRLLDVRAPERIKPRDQAAFDTTRLACEQLGWGYEVAGPVPVVMLANLRWLAGYRHPRHDLAETARHLRALFSRPQALMSGARVLGSPIAVLPVLFHLLWTQQLRTDLTIPLGPDSMVATVARPAEADQ
ncbi:MAG TPA: TnsA-like heteromeric transposase endonuclease subunit [Amycolatopsis sp.]|nr:TnsA-like heteromeric transposase endonuclease subunit [Amycolatopsis sp.]